MPAHLSWTHCCRRSGEVGPTLAAYVRPVSTPLPPEGVRSVAILHGAPVRIVLAGDSTVNIGGGWGPGFCALLTPNVECINLARNGRSSKSFYDEGLWKDVIAQHGDYILSSLVIMTCPQGSGARDRSRHHIRGQHAALCCGGSRCRCTSNHRHFPFAAELQGRQTGGGSQRLRRCCKTRLPRKKRFRSSI